GGQGRWPVSREGGRFGSFEEPSRAVAIPGDPGRKGRDHAQRQARDGQGPAGRGPVEARRLRGPSGVASRRRSGRAAGRHGGEVREGERKVSVVLSFRTDSGPSDARASSFRG